MLADGENGPAASELSRAPPVKPTHVCKVKKCRIELHCLMSAWLCVTGVRCCRVLHMLMRRRELSKAAESSASCTDKGSGHVPPEHARRCRGSLPEDGGRSNMGED